MPKMSIFGFHQPFHKQLTYQNQSDDQYQQPHQSNAKEIHGLLLTFSWFFLLHLGIWAHYFKSYRYAILLHIICMSSIVLLTVIAITIMITAQGSAVIYESFFHQTIGFYLVVGLLPITVINGCLTKIFMNTYKIKTMWMFSTKQLHKILGWVMLVLIKVPLATGMLQHEKELFVLIFMIDSISYGLFWYLKLNRSRIGVVMREEYKKIRNNNKILTTFNQYFHTLYGKCFLFANYIYPIQKVLVSHPGGISFILKVRNREIDRHIYGMELTQDENCAFSYRHAHSPDFLTLSQKPIAKIQIDQPFFHLSESNPVQIQSIYTSLNQKMFLVYFQVKGSRQQVEIGYKNLNQLGRFYALTFNGITRLYSVVYFLLPNNVKWMYGLMANKCHKYKKYRKSISKTEQKMIQLEQSLLESQIQTSGLYIPIFVKKYNDGNLTFQLISQFRQPQQNSLVLSESRGFGIGLSSQQIHEKRQKRIVMFAGGTGLNPYCDLIDILFKKNLMRQDKEQYEKIKDMNPILEEESLLQYNYAIYIGIESLQYIHPITLYQLEQLSNCNAIECYLKSKNYQHSIKSDLKNLSESRIPHSNIHYLPLTYRFQQAVEKQIKLGQDTKIFVCGPPCMIKGIQEKMKQLQFSEYHIRFL